MQTPLQQLLIALIRSTLSAEASPSGLGELSPKTWHSLYRLAAEQGVMGLLFPTVEGHLASPRVPREVAYGWMLSVERVKQRAKRMEQATDHLLSLYAAEGLHPLLLKGRMLARYYPCPSLRESGDVDLYLGADYERGNQIARAHGAEMQPGHLTEKHAAFEFEGVLFENHCTLLDLRGGVARRLEQMLQRELQGAEQTPEGFLISSPLFNALFVLRHAASHFAWGISLRHLCDWGLLLHHEGSQIDFEQWHECLAKGGMLAFHNAFTRAAELVTGLPLHDYLLGESGCDQTDRVVEDCFFSCNRASRPRTLGQKLHRMWQTRWKYKILLPDSYLRAWLHAITYRLRH